MNNLENEDKKPEFNILIQKQPGKEMKKSDTLRPTSKTVSLSSCDLHGLEHYPFSVSETQEAEV